LENYIVDYVKAYRNVHVITTSSESVDDVFERLASFNIETCIHSGFLDKTSVIFHRMLLCDGKDSSELVNDVMEGVEYSLYNNYSLVDIGGLFVGGRSGLSHSILEALMSSKINIEYQIFGSNRFSFLIEDRFLNRCLKNITYMAKVRDSKIDLFD
jgi:aspartokinase